MRYRTYQLFMDLLEENHILIAGATGSGKSVLIQNLVFTAVCRGHRLILVDPKKVELSQWSRTENCLMYADEKGQMIEALRYAVRIIENRYQRMKARNQKLSEEGRVYVVVDEFADLMLTARKEVQPLLQRITAIGRAAGVHCIMATQVPIATVIRTEIKANCDCRIGLRTACAQDSRNIVGVAGCELLPNPKREHRAEAWIRRGADIDLWEIPMIPENDIREMIQYRNKRRKSGFWKLVFGI